MANSLIKIETEEQYNVIMKRIDLLMQKGEKHLSDKEANELQNLAIAAETYEKRIYKIPPF